MTIVVNPNVTPTFTQVAAICVGATINPLPTTSVNGITGTWLPVLNNTATTTYTFTPTAGQCATTATMTIVVNSVATPTGMSTQSFVQGATIANLDVNPSNVIWFSTNANALANSNPLPSNTLLVNATTYYAVSESGSCRSTPFAVTVSETLGVENQTKIEFSLYPNPAENMLHIDTLSDIKLVEVFGILGQIVIKTNQKQINVSNLSKGMYMIKIQDTKNTVSTKKFIKN
jgi:hypothetical protein